MVTSLTKMPYNGQKYGFLLTHLNILNFLAKYCIFIKKFVIQGEGVQAYSDKTDKVKGRGRVGKC